MRGVIYRAVLALGLLGTALLMASAPPTNPTLDWSAPAACPDEAAVNGALEHYLQRPLEDEPTRGVASVQGNATDGYDLALDLIGADGSRTRRSLFDADCRVLADAAALMLAISLDPNAAIRADGPVLSAPPQEPQPQEPQPQEPQPQEPLPVEPPPRPEPEIAQRPEPPCRPGPSLLRTSARERASLRPSCGALLMGFSVGSGLLPGVGPGFVGSAALLWPRLRLSLSVRHDLQQPARTDDDARLGGDLRLTVAQALACARLGYKRAEFPLCGGLELGAMRGVGVGVDTPRADRLFWSAAVAQAGVGFSPTRRFAARLDVAGIAPLANYAFVVAGLGAIHEPSPVAVRATIAAELRFP